MVDGVVTGWTTQSLPGTGLKVAVLALARVAVGTTVATTPAAAMARNILRRVSCSSLCMGFPFGENSAQSGVISVVGERMDGTGL
ncbi:hypothetical protein [Streptomyces sp. NPDC057582]|uniref:hypothetical protein n=1 Tax=Streptomyces sp. NPDC057582 TaxID=3346174 RepID=UPI0036C8EEA2